MCPLIWIRAFIHPSNCLLLTHLVTALGGAHFDSDGFTSNTTADNGFSAVFASWATLRGPIEEWLPAMKRGLVSGAAPQFVRAAELQQHAHQSTA